MRRLLYLLILLVIFSGGCINSIDKQETVSRAKMEFNELIYNFGALPNGTVAKCSFRFRNNSKSVLIINNIIAGCGCTRFKWPKNPTRAGENGIIEITYNAAGSGTFRKSISVFSNAGNSPIHLYIKGEICL